MIKFDTRKFLYLIIIAVLYILGCLLLLFTLKEINKAEDKPRKFGTTYMTMNNPYFKVIDNSIKEVVESNGDILISRDPAQDQEKQNNQIQEMIDEGVSAIFLNPVDWKGVRPALIACKKAGIPVFNIDTYVYDEEYVTSIIASDNYLAGVQCAQDLMKKLPSADIVILDCPQMRSISQRVQGFKDTIATNGNYRVSYEESGGGELEVAMAVMNDIIKSGVSINVIMGGNDPSALGALAALQKNLRDEGVIIYGVDGSPDVKNMIKDGLIEGTSAQRPSEMGSIAAQMAYDYLSGKKIDKEVVVPVSLVTKENLDKFDIDGWQ